MYKNKLKYGKIMRRKTVNRIVEKINQEYAYEKEHTQEVADYSINMAKILGFRTAEVEDIKIAGLLHDIGKIGIPIDLLTKAKDLTTNEFDLIKRHPEISYQILKSVDQYVKIAKAVLHHHERWDGTGYPEGLAKEEIPLNSRILAIADAYQAMISERVYQKRKTKSEAIEELNRCSGFQFDPRLVRIFINEVLSSE
jgi:putative nucleotidyltransferase with HDIG domain